MASNSSIFLSRLTSGGNGSNTDATSYATASITPVNGQIHVAVVVSLKATTPDTPTCSGTNGFNGTWTQIGTTVTIQTPAGNFIGVSAFRSQATSGTAGVITFNFTNTQLGAVWDVLTSPFINTTTPVVQTKTVTDTSASTTLSVTMDAALSAAANWVLGIFAAQQAGTISGTSNNYTLAPSDTNHQISDGASLRTCIGSVITLSAGSFTASVGKVGFLIEINQDGTGAGGGSSSGDGGNLSGGLQ